MLAAVGFYKRLNTKCADVGCRLFDVTVVFPVVEQYLHFWESSRQERIRARSTAVPWSYLCFASSRIQQFLLCCYLVTSVT